MPFWLYSVEETRVAPSDWANDLTIRIDYFDPIVAKMPAGTFSAEDFAASTGTDVDETSKYTPPSPVN